MKFEIPAHISKQLIQISSSGFFGKFEKRISLSEKKTPSLVGGLKVKIAETLTMDFIFPNYYLPSLFLRFLTHDFQFYFW